MRLFNKKKAEIKLRLIDCDYAPEDMKNSYLFHVNL